MRKTILNKKSLISLLVVMLLCFSFGIFTTTAYADEMEVTPKTVDQVTYEMASSAQVRIATDYKTNGLRFQASMSLKDYESLLAYGYDSLTFGIVIAPADYLTEGKDFTEENLFGDDAIYGWAEYDEVNGAWGDYNGDKTEIINIYKDKLTKDTKNDIAYIRASITNLNYNNIARDFVARGYIIANDGQDYAMANYAEKSSFSMAYVAEKSIAIAEENEFNSEAGYLDQATCQSLAQTYLEEEKIYNDMTSTVVKLNNYAADGNVVNVEGLGTVNYITDGKGNKFDFVQDGANVTIDISDLNTDKEFEATLYTFDGTYYKLYKVTANYDNKTKITNVAELEEMRNSTNGDYILMNDLNLSEYSLEAVSTKFSGTFDGNGFIIYAPTFSSSSNNGLFYNLYGTVKNLGVINAVFSGQGGTVCTTLASGAKVDNVYISVSNIKSVGVGGLTRNSWAEDVSVTNTVINVKATTKTTTKTHTYLDGSTHTGLNLGIFAHDMSVDLDFSSVHFISSVTNLLPIGNFKEDKVYTAENVRQNIIDNNKVLTADALDTGINTNTYKVQNISLCRLAIYTTISTVDELLDMRTKKSGKYILANDIDLKGVNLPGLSVSFSGVFDGNGKVIRNMSLSNQHTSVTYVGFFRELSSGSVVRNVAFVDASMTSGGGIIAAQIKNNITIDNVYIGANLQNSPYSGAIARQIGTSPTESAPNKITNCVFCVTNIHGNSGILFGTAATSATAYFDFGNTYYTTNSSSNVVTSNHAGSATFKTFMETTYADNFYKKATLLSAINSGTITVGYKTLAQLVLA